MWRFGISRSGNAIKSKEEYHRGRVLFIYHCHLCAIHSQCRRRHLILFFSSHYCSINDDSLYSKVNISRHRRVTLPISGNRLPQTPHYHPVLKKKMNASVLCGVCKWVREKVNAWWKCVSLSCSKLTLQLWRPRTSESIYCSILSVQIQRLNQAMFWVTEWMKQQRNNAGQTEDGNGLYRSVKITRPNRCSVVCVCLADCPLQLREICILYSRDIFIACLRVAQSVST